MNTKQSTLKQLKTHYATDIEVIEPQFAKMHKKYKSEKNICIILRGMR